MSGYADPFVWFAACHDRIRRFVGGLERLAALDDLADPRVSPAAEQAARYFREGLPRHGEDEDLSLAPRMRALGVDAAVEAELARMTADHEEMDRGLPALLADLDALAAGRTVDPADLRARAAWLAALLLDHIAREEAVIFPAGQALGPADRAEMVREMDARRQ